MVELIVQQLQDASGQPITILTAVKNIGHRNLFISNLCWKYQEKLFKKSYWNCIFTSIFQFFGTTKLPSFSHFYYVNRLEPGQIKSGFLNYFLLKFFFTIFLSFCNKLWSWWNLIKFSFINPYINLVQQGECQRFEKYIYIFKFLTFRIIDNRHRYTCITVRTLRYQPMVKFSAADSKLIFGWLPKNRNVKGLVQIIYLPSSSMLQLQGLQVTKR